MNATSQYLRDMLGIHDDLSLAKFIEDHAYMGEPNAQYALGLIYAEGRGVMQDAVTSYAWLTLAMLQADSEAADMRYLVSGMMTPGQIAIAEQRAARLLMDIGSDETEH